MDMGENELGCWVPANSNSRCSSRYYNSHCSLRKHKLTNQMSCKYAHNTMAVFPGDSKKRRTRSLFNAQLWFLKLKALKRSVCFLKVPCFELSGPPTRVKWCSFRVKIYNSWFAEYLKWWTVFFKWNILDQNISDFHDGHESCKSSSVLVVNLCFKR